MCVIDTEEHLRSFLETSAFVQPELPVVISECISGVSEIESMLFATRLHLSTMPSLSMLGMEEHTQW